LGGAFTFGGAKANEAKICPPSLASRFSTALSKIIDFNGAVNENEKKGFNSLGNFGETDDDM
jgi:hypothetical protein